MRYRYVFEDGKHLVKVRDDQQNWLDKETQEFPTAEAAQAAARDMDAKALAPAAPVKPKPDVTTKAGVVAEFKEADRKGSGDKKDSDVDPHDFTVIAGVGDRTAERLRENGVTTLRMLSRVSATKAEELGVKPEWIEEAKRLTS